jgi:tRNA U34 5-carboxymethylaminomethyl modifying enzyme MnmG/GidA
LGRANKNTIRIVNENLKHSALYSGESRQLARYVRHLRTRLSNYGKDSHQIILEPEGLDIKRFAAGWATVCLGIQLKAVRSIEGLNRLKLCALHTPLNMTGGSCSVVPPRKK